MTNLTVAVHDITGGLVIVEMAGQATIDRLGVLERALRRVSSQRPAIVVLDLSALEAISPVALGTLGRFHIDVARSGGEIRIAAPQPEVSRALRHTGLDVLFEMHLSVESAVLGMAALEHAAA